MQPRPPFDRDLQIILTVSVVSILGLAWIFLANYRSESSRPPTAEPTAIPFDVTPFEGQPLPPSMATATFEEISLTATETSTASYPGLPTETLPSTSSPVTESPLVPSATATPDQAQALPAGKYDNTHPNIVYGRQWAYKMNSGTKFAYKGTLHISTSIGNEASFRFTGQQLYLGYQRGRNFGIVTVIIDGQSYSFHEQALGNIWRSPELSPGTHSVRIIHESGESVNLDYIEVLDAS